MNESFECEECGNPCINPNPGEEGEVATEQNHHLCDLCIIDFRHQKSEYERKLEELKRSLRVERRLNNDLRKELQGEREKLTTEREGLISWMRSRRAQQQQVLQMRMAQETQHLVEIEIGFIDRYLEVIEKGQHRNTNPAVSVPDPQPFKSLRTMEREDIEALIRKDLAGVRAVKRTRPDDKSCEGAEHALLTLLEQIQGSEHRRNP